MPHRSQDNDGPRTTKRTKRLWFIAIGAGLFVVIICCLWAAGLFQDRPDADERLAEIEAARAIPDSENAATIYAGLFRDPKATTLLDYWPEFLEPPVYGQVMNEPWFDENHPELAAWIQEHQYIIDRLLDASHLEKCRFPVSLDIAQVISVVDFASMRQWAFLLSFAANNDIAEGRNGDAVTKWGCILRMANHLRQQPMLIDHLAANGIGKIALERIAWFVIEGSSTEMHLQEIEAMPLPTSDHWAEHVAEIREVEALRLRKVMESYGLLGRIRLHFFLRRMNYEMYGTLKGPDVIGSAGASYQRQTASARGIRILVALKRCQNAAGRWPASLDEIRPSLPTEILTDPFNKGPFIYKPVGDTFTLYSRGENNIDEDGEHVSADDWPIWPPRGRMAEAEQKDVNEP
jgi:hypothetical protein